MLSPLRLFPFLLLVFAGCNKFEYSPNQQSDSHSLSDVNNMHIAQILSGRKDDTTRFILCGDTQRAYDNCAAFVQLANKVPNLDFVILDGDISDFGLLFEMEQVDKLLSKLKVPYVALIGNHDLADNGERVYQSMYGNPNFTFVYNDITFVCHNSNSREYDYNGRIPDLAWLDKALHPAQPTPYYIGVAHVPPLSEDFDQKLKGDYLNLLQKHSGMLATLYAHTGKTETFYPSGPATPPLITTGGIDNRKFSIITVINGDFSIENREY